MAFSFSFSGADIDLSSDHRQTPERQPATVSSATSAFPVQGKPLLPVTRHDLSHMLSQLPSKLAFGSVEILLDDGRLVRVPRRELWDVRLQIMAEAEDGSGGGRGEDSNGLDSHDVKTGVYEGGFKSWESSVDMVKVLAARKDLTAGAKASRIQIIELGCGTALPTLALFQWLLSAQTASAVHQVDARRTKATDFILADYNPTVLQLVTLPNIILVWALSHRADELTLQSALTFEDDESEAAGELELSPAVIRAFTDFLSAKSASLTFLSGAWSVEFVECVYASSPLHTFGDCQAQPGGPSTFILGAETIYSPFALNAFAETVFSILRREGKKARRGDQATAVAIVAAKKLYFGVGGSLDDFTEMARQQGATVTELREESEGVRRGVVQCCM